MNFFKSSKYKLSGSSKSKKTKDTSSPAQFHQLETASPQKTSAKQSAPKPPANDVTVCFKISNTTSFPWKLEGESALFPEEIAANENKLIRIGQVKENTFSAKYSIEKDEQKFYVTFDVTRREPKWFVKVDWGGLGDGFRFAPVDEIEVPGPDDDGVAVELSYQAE